MQAVGYAQPGARFDPGSSTSHSGWSGDFLRRAKMAPNWRLSRPAHNLCPTRSTYCGRFAL